MKGVKPEVERRLCPCGCGGEVVRKNKYATSTCYGEHQRVLRDEALRREHPGALVGKEVEFEVERRLPEYRTVCPACGCLEAAERRDVPLPVLMLPGRALPFLRFGCLNCSAEYLAGCGESSPVSLLACGVYFLRCMEFIKIGYASDLVFRSQHYLTDNPFPIDLIGFVPLAPEKMRGYEAELHTRFASLRHRGEWFRADLELLAWVDEHATRSLARIKAEYSL